MTLPVPTPRPSYSQARENLVKAIPPKIICLLACGGRDCRYEGSACWRPSQQAIRGVFSTWVTDSIVAMARPSTHLIKRYSIIEQFQRLKIKSIINMQLPGEHAHCGPPLEPGSGFTYSPQTFMENGIFFYNFGMTDFGVSSPAGMLDAVKVLAFAVGEGRVAVHCHAGLGRTGVLIACYLIFTLRVSPSEAIHYVRIKRSRSIQTRAQIGLVFEFARLLAPQLVQFPDVTCVHGTPFSLPQYLRHQRVLLHGEEARKLRNVPKIIHFLCARLMALAWGQGDCPVARLELERAGDVLEMTATVRDTLRAKKFTSILRDSGHSRKAPHSSVPVWDDPDGFLERKREVLLKKRSYSDSDLCKIVLYQLGGSQSFPSAVSESQAVAKAMAEQEAPGAGIAERLTLLQDELNSSECSWAVLAAEPDPAVLISLLWSWLDKLKEPVLKGEDVERITSSNQGQGSLGALSKAQAQTISCMLRCVGQVTSLCRQREEAVLWRLVRALTRECAITILRKYLVACARRGGLGSAHPPESEGRRAREPTAAAAAAAEGKDNNMSSRKVMAIQARKRRAKGKKDKAAHHKRAGTHRNTKLPLVTLAWRLTLASFLPVYS
ncbi:hypothetical protein GJAV_G00272900 [Gymnothorax javanicus]|nr:hypothetical protein GJAV_G00272900 [Gymnothorax javanicus]